MGMLMWAGMGASCLLEDAAGHVVGFAIDNVRKRRVAIVK